MPESSPSKDPVAAARGRRTILLVAAACLAPVLASYIVYYFFPRGAQVNYGTLVATPAPAIEGAFADGTPFRLSDLRGRWVVLAGSTYGCDAACERTLYATRQSQTMQGSERDRIVRVWLDGSGGTFPPELLTQHSGLVVARVPAGALTALPGAQALIWIVDPLGNLVLSYPGDPDIKGLANDLSRLLRASRIG